MAGGDATAPELLAGERMPRLRGLRVSGVGGAKDRFTTQVTMRLKELFGGESSSKADKISHKMIFQVRGVG